MKSWDWKTGKSYFTSVKGEPSLLEMVDTYEQAVTNFAKRFLTWFQELYKADVDRTNVLIRESNGPPEEWEELLGRPQSPSPQSPP
jgi:tRNA A37 N6-isopentenylltransferase MiaA